MSTEETRKNLMGVVATIGASFLASGALLNYPTLIVVGLMTLLTYAMWLYGNTLQRGKND